MDQKRIERDKSYTLFQLAERAGMRVADVQDLVERGKLPSHYTDDTLIVNGKDFLKFFERVREEHLH